MGFAGWCLSLRGGRAGLGRIIGRCVAVVLLVLDLPDFLLPTLDAVLGPACPDAWGPPERFSTQIAWGLYDCVALDCAGFGDGAVTGLSAADKRFLCKVRGHDRPYDLGVEGWDEVSDQDVLAQGRHLCALAARHGGDIAARAVSEAPQASLAGALADLCPAVAGAQQAEAGRRQAESDAYVAQKERACAAHPRHGPKIRPVRQRRATMWTEADGRRSGRRRRTPGPGVPRHREEACRLQMTEGRAPAPGTRPS